MCACVWVERSAQGNSAIVKVFDTIFKLILFKLMLVIGLPVMMINRFHSNVPCRLRCQSWPNYLKRKKKRKDPMHVPTLHTSFNPQFFSSLNMKCKMEKKNVNFVGIFSLMGQQFFFSDFSIAYIRWDCILNCSFTISWISNDATKFNAYHKWIELNEVTSLTEIE